MTTQDYRERFIRTYSQTHDIVKATHALLLSFFAEFETLVGEQGFLPSDAIFELEQKWINLSKSLHVATPRVTGTNKRRVLPRTFEGQVLNPEGWMGYIRVRLPEVYQTLEQIKEEIMEEERKTSEEEEEVKEKSREQLLRDKRAEDRTGKSSQTLK